MPSEIAHTCVHARERKGKIRRQRRVQYKLQQKRTPHVHLGLSKGACNARLTLQHILQHTLQHMLQQGWTLHEHLGLSERVCDARITLQHALQHTLQQRRILHGHLGLSEGACNARLSDK